MNFFSNFIRKFYFLHEKEKNDVIIDSIYKGVVFRGTNLWILIFAIFVASLGLNVNSTAVIIGAMLISPLMGPIMGMGLGLGINDLALLKKAFNNYLVAVGTGLATSTIYFLISPLNEAHSEILARTSPTIYDVLIAFFGGMAGSVATTSRQKGNVIPGVAIATALMPPLCTAGYGVATLNYTIFLGALYLFCINTVFIGIATLITVRFLKIPFQSFPDEAEKRKTKRWVIIIAVVTILPSLYFGYRIVQQERFTYNANQFVDKEVDFQNSYLLNREVDAPNNRIRLVFGGQKVSDSMITGLRKKLSYYDLTKAKLEVKQGFAFLDQPLEVDPATRTLKSKEKELYFLRKVIDSLRYNNTEPAGLYQEISVLQPEISSLTAQAVTRNLADSTVGEYMVLLGTKKELPEEEREKLTNWLAQRLKKENLSVLFIRESELGIAVQDTLPKKKEKPAN